VCGRGETHPADACESRGVTLVDENVIFITVLDLVRQAKNDGLPKDLKYQGLAVTGARKALRSTGTQVASLGR